MDSPDADRIRELEALTNDGDNSEFTKRFGEVKETGFSLSDALWTCSDMFGRSAHKNSHRRILLFTREHAPHATDASKTQQAKTKARDLADNGITIDLMHMAPPGGAKFQLEFYQVRTVAIELVHWNFWSLLGGLTIYYFGKKRDKF